MRTSDDPYVPDRGPRNVHLDVWRIKAPNWPTAIGRLSVLCVTTEFLPGERGSSQFYFWDRPSWLAGHRLARLIARGKKISLSAGTSAPDGVVAYLSIWHIEREALPPIQSTASAQKK